MTARVNVIGAGRVGRTLLRLLAGHPAFEVVSVASAHLASAEAAVREAGGGIAVAGVREMQGADLWLLTVPDTRIAAVAAELAKCAQVPSIAIHCSGFHTADIMAPLRAKGWRLASAHPNLSFADPAVSAARFPGTYVGIEGDVPEVDALFATLGAKTFPIPSESKALYHAAAVITNNFTTVLQAVALEAWEAAGVPDAIARELNATLLQSTLENIARLGPAEALTGPAARGDRAVVEAQGRAVAAWHEEAGSLYRLLSTMAERLKTRGVALADQEPPRQ